MKLSPRLVFRSLEGVLGISQSGDEFQLENISKWTQTIRPICLPKGDEKFENGNMCMVAGWGATETHSVSRFVSIGVPRLDSHIF